ncbi:hypothetical protein SAMN04489796_101779 [Winogradskyella thalassocola]|uniref:Uncharacterized protein n=1 Tax=Winogradskyella thalassocola TaxID=262004 RepID=A0A1G7XNR6_9FLAO|nr:hypothetical protein SAMN04489796_101779 [Winogradskyella thalassocola]
MLQVDVVKKSIKKLPKREFRQSTSKINVLLTIIYVKYDSIILAKFVVYF